MLHGTPASEGIGLGRVMIVEEAKLEYNKHATNFWLENN